MKSIVSIFLVLFLPFAVFAQTKMQLQMGEEGLEMLVSEGRHAVGIAQVKPEGWNWNRTEASNYVVRWSAGSVEYTYHHNAQSQSQSYFTQQGQRVSYSQMSEIGQKVGGQFVTGIQGYVEKFDQKGNERPQLVFRNNKGQFVTSLSLAPYVSSSWERFKIDGESVWRYVYRWSEKSGSSLRGQFFNHVGVDESQCYWNTRIDNSCPIIPVRETSDKNNGVFVTLLYGQKKMNRRHNAYYCKYYVPEGDSKNPGEMIASLKFTRLQSICGVK